MMSTVIISTKDRLAELSVCLESLRAQTRRPDEVLVVDAGGDPRVKALVEGMDKDFKKVSYHHLPSSLPQARNHGVRHSSGEAVVFLDDDILLEPDFLEELLGTFERDPRKRLGGVCGDILNHKRDSEPVKKAFKRALQLPYDGDGRFRLSGSPTLVYGTAGEKEVEFLPGGMTAWRREVFAEFSFDDKLPGLGVNEDVDFSYRVSRKWRNAYNPRAKIRNLRPEPKREATLGYLRQELWSSWYLYRKNLPGGPLTLAATVLQTCGILLRFLFRLRRS